MYIKYSHIDDILFKKCENEGTFFRYHKNIVIIYILETHLAVLRGYALLCTEGTFSAQDGTRIPTFKHTLHSLEPSPGPCLGFCSVWNSLLYR